MKHQRRESKDGLYFFLFKKKERKKKVVTVLAVSSYARPVIPAGASLFCRSRSCSGRRIQQLRGRDFTGRESYQKGRLDRVPSAPHVLCTSRLLLPTSSSSPFVLLLRRDELKSNEAGHLSQHGDAKEETTTDCCSLLLSNCSSRCWPTGSVPGNDMTNPVVIASEPSTSDPVQSSYRSYSADDLYPGGVQSAGLIADGDPGPSKVSCP